MSKLLFTITIVLVLHSLLFFAGDVTAETVEDAVNYKAEQIYVFSTSNKNWRLYNWDKITSLVEFGYHDDELVKFAHSKNVTVSTVANINETWLANATLRTSWVKDVVSQVMAQKLDGVNVDFESIIFKNETDRRDGFTSLLRELSTSLRAVLPHAQLTIDFAWSPACIDFRCYDYAALAEIVDFVFIMAYDERSQIVGPCTAWANSAYSAAFSGLKQYLRLNIPASKIVLGVPWYGYDYTCIAYEETTKVCHIEQVPFRGAPCSDAAGRQFGYSYMMEKVNQSLTGLLWDKLALAPYATYKDEKTGVLHQIWFDNVLSLDIKYQLARQLGLLGVGMWEADSLDYADTPTKRAYVREMWNALPDRKKK